MASERISIVCIGNTLHGDDGVGDAVWQQLSQAVLPAHVRLQRAPFAGPAILSAFEDCDRVIVVDALQGFGLPGSVHCVAAEAIADEDAPTGHGAGIGDWLAQLPLWLTRVPAIEVVGIEAAQITPFVPGLSPVVAAAVPAMCGRVMERIGHG